jgi:D-arabinose 1-dehydrogenase-like Zn-dependent alcohol dehydrogenase
MNANVPKKQNAVIFGGTGKLFLQTIPVPNIKDNEVLLKVEACGVCGTDLNIYDVKGFSYGIPGQVLGHEIVGTIVKTGANVKMFKIGNRVCVDPNVFCGKCHYCHNNQTEQCDNMNCIGIHINGGYEQYVAIPDTQLYLLPKNIQ